MTLDGEARGDRAAVVRMAVSSRHLSRARRRSTRSSTRTRRSRRRSRACIAAFPPFHYMVAVAGGRDIRCAPYATFGTQELSDHAVAALDGPPRVPAREPRDDRRRARRSQAALALAVEVETLAEMYWRALQIGEPALLSDAEMEVVLEKFRTLRAARRRLTSRHAASTVPGAEFPVVNNSLTMSRGACRDRHGTSARGRQRPEGGARHVPARRPSDSGTKALPDRLVCVRHMLLA